LSTQIDIIFSRAGKVPDWVAKRIRPLSDDQRQEIKVVERIAGKIAGTFH
jgi:hypothetical protein